jgi:hypothetical protein
MFTSRIFNGKRYMYAGSKPTFKLAQEESRKLKRQGYRSRFTTDTQGYNIWKWKEV